MIGVDITKISRFANKKANFVKRILSTQELEEYNKKTENKQLFLAVHWAIKEAIFKADNSYLNFAKINIQKVSDKYFFEDFEISTSQEDDYLIAFVLKRRG